MKLSFAGVRRQVLFAVAAASLVCAVPARADPVGGVAASTSQAETADPQQSWGDLGRRFVLFVSGKPALLSTGDIDEIVGNPWQLSLATQAKASTLRPRLRMEMYQFVAGNMHAYQLVPESSAMAGGSAAPAGKGFPWMTALSPQAGRQLARNLADTALSHFRPEDLADLTVYALSRQAFFPKSDREWSHWKNAIVADDVLLGSAVGLTLASTDSLRAQVSGVLARLPGDTVRFGWYTEFRDLGFQLHPILRGGFKAKSPSVDISAGINENFGVGPVGELRSLEVVANNHWIERIATPSGWELALTATAHYVLAHQIAAKEGTVQAVSDMYFRRPSFAGSAFLSLLLRANIVMDFGNGSAVSGAVGVEHSRYEIAAVVRVGYSSVRSAEAEGGNIGVLFAGGLEPRLDRMRAAMFGGANAVKLRLDNLRMIETKIARLDENHAPQPFSSQHPADSAEELEIWREHLARGRSDIAVELVQYLTDRDAFFQYEGKVNRSTYDMRPETYGPLPAAQREAARSEIAAQQ